MQQQVARRRAELVNAYGSKEGRARTSAVGKLTGNAPQRMPLVLTDEFLGEGATAKVWLAKFGPTRSEVAAKVVTKATLNGEQLGWIRDEIAIHKQLRHPHICTLHGAIEDASSITMVLSLCRGGRLERHTNPEADTTRPLASNAHLRASQARAPSHLVAGSLCDTMGRALESQSPLPEDRCRHAYAQLCGALHYCHRTGVVHRDVKARRHASNAPLSPHPTLRVTYNINVPFRAPAAAR